MERSEAQELARKTYFKATEIGRPRDAVALVRKALNEAGYKSERTGLPLKEAVAAVMSSPIILENPRKEETKSRKLFSVILDSKDMSNDEKIALLELIRDKL